MGSAGDRPPAGDRPSPGAFPPRRCAATGSGTAGKARRGRWLGGVPPPASFARRGARGVLPPPSVTAPRQQRLAESRGRGSQTRRRALPPPGAHPPRGSLPRGGARLRDGRAGVPGGAGPPLPRRDRSPTPASPPPRGGTGAGRTVPSAPRAGRAVGPGGFVGHARAKKKKNREASARGRRRCRLPTRPVLKHGPRSLTRARVGGSLESRRGAMKVKAGGGGGAPRVGGGAWGGSGAGSAVARPRVLPPFPRPVPSPSPLRLPAAPRLAGPRWDPEASPVRRGRTTGPSRPPRRGGGAGAHVLGPERW